MCSPLCDQSHLSSSEPFDQGKLSRSAVTCSSLVPDFLYILFVCFLAICMCGSVFLGHFVSFPRRPQVSHLQYLMWALIRGEELPNMSATCWLRSHTQGPPVIFHREEERDAYIILTEPEWRETSLCYLHTHTHCERFIVQGFNGALTHTSLSLCIPLPSLTRTHKHTSIHHSPSSSSVFLRLSSIWSHISLYFSFPSPVFPFLLLLLSPKTAPNFSFFAHLIEIQ